MSGPAAILDIDGTLVDTNYQHAIAWYQAIRQHDVPVLAERAEPREGVVVVGVDERAVDVEDGRGGLALAHVLGLPAARRGDARCGAGATRRTAPRSPRAAARPCGG